MGLDGMISLRLIVVIVWATLSARLIWDNRDLLDSISVWRAIAMTVILCIGASVFFLSDCMEVLLDVIAGEEDDS